MPLTDSDYKTIKQLFDDSHRNQAIQYKELLEDVREELRASREREDSLMWIKGWLMMVRIKLGKTELEVSLAGVITVLGITILGNIL